MRRKRGANPGAVAIDEVENASRHAGFGIIRPILGLTLWACRFAAAFKIAPGDFVKPPTY